jgi:C4-dicarboxylate-specific signal transduction histidine kinase
VEVKSRDSLPAMVRADGDMLRQVLVNLSNNSALAIAERNRSAGTITLQVVRDGPAFCIEVADNGAGVPPEIRPRLFEPYTTSRGIGEGMGLGLAISKKIMLDHGGDLELAGSSADGTTFRLTLPAMETGA